MMSLLSTNWAAKASVILTSRFGKTATDVASCHLQCCTFRDFPSPRKRFQNFRDRRRYYTICISGASAYCCCCKEERREQAFNLTSTSANNVLLSPVASASFAIHAIYILPLKYAYCLLDDTSLAWRRAGLEFYAPETFS